MSRIKSAHTKPEMIIRSYLHRHGYRFRLHDKKLPGKPDIILKKYQTVIFVNGCYWHRHKNCKLSTMPKTNKKFWEEKFNSNIKRDKIKNNELKKMGFKVLTLWECEIKEKSILENFLSDIRD